MTADVKSGQSRVRGKAEERVPDHFVSVLGVDVEVTEPPAFKRAIPRVDFGVRPYRLRLRHYKSSHWIMWYGLNSTSLLIAS
jgi:hypothetical protein